MRTLIPLLIVLACPLMMIFMMRGMHGGRVDSKQQVRSVQQSDRAHYDNARDERIAELERDVSTLRDRVDDRDEAGTGRR